MKVVLDEVRDPSTPPEQLKAIMEALPTHLTPAGRMEVALALTENPACPPDILDTLADWQGNGRVNIQRGIADNPNAEESTLLKLAAYKDKILLLGLAENPHATSSVLLCMTQGKSALAQGWIEYPLRNHPNVTPEILQILREHSIQRLASFERDTQRFQAQKTATSTAYWRQFPLSAFTEETLKDMTWSDLDSLYHFGPTPEIRERAQQIGQFEKEHTVLLPAPQDAMKKMSAAELLRVSRSDPDPEIRDAAKQVQKERTATTQQKQMTWDMEP